jgi:hypothetical protein
VSDWEPATEAEIAMREALRVNDQEQYFRILARTDILLPVAGDSPSSGSDSAGWGTWTADGRTHVLGFTSSNAFEYCLAGNAGTYRRIPFRELATRWPNVEWWLAIDPGLPIEGYLPSWFVTQVSRGDVRLPGRTLGARARIEQVDSLRARAVAQIPLRTVPTQPPLSPIDRARRDPRLQEPAAAEAQEAGNAAQTGENSAPAPGMPFPGGPVAGARRQPPSGPNHEQRPDSQPDPSAGARPSVAGAPPGINVPSALQPPGSPLPRRPQPAAPSTPAAGEAPTLAPGPFSYGASAPSPASATSAGSPLPSRAARSNAAEGEVPFRDRKFSSAPPEGGYFPAESTAPPPGAAPAPPPAAGAPPVVPPAPPAMPLRRRPFRLSCRRPPRRRHRCRPKRRRRAPREVGGRDSSAKRISRPTVRRPSSSGRHPPRPRPDSRRTPSRTGSASRPRPPPLRHRLPLRRRPRSHRPRRRRDARSSRTSRRRTIGNCSATCRRPRPPRPTSRAGPPPRRPGTRISPPRTPRRLSPFRRRSPVRARSAPMGSRLLARRRVIRMWLERLHLALYLGRMAKDRATPTSPDRRPPMPGRISRAPSRPATAIRPDRAQPTRRATRTWPRPVQALRHLARRAASRRATRTWPGRTLRLRRRLPVARRVMRTLRLVGLSRVCSRLGMAIRPGRVLCPARPTATSRGTRAWPRRGLRAASRRDSEPHRPMFPDLGRRAIRTSRRPVQVRRVPATLSRPGRQELRRVVSLRGTRISRRPARVHRAPANRRATRSR